MNNNGNSVVSFIKRYNELKNSYKEILFNKSFNKNIVEKNIELVKQKRYAISDEIWNIEEKNNYQFLLLLLKLIGKHVSEYKKDIEKMNNILNKDVSFSKEFTLDILTNKQKKITDFARSKSISIDFLTFYSLFATYPYRESVAQLIQSEENLEEHISGYCPVCGHWPGMSYIIGKEGKKIMACICCGTHWSFRRLKCSFCLTSDKDALGYLNVEGEDEISAYICDNCRRYLKTKRIESEKIDFSKESPLLDYMCTGFIDIAAMQNKYLQESMLGTRFDGPKDKNIEFYLEKLK